MPQSQPTTTHAPGQGAGPSQGEAAARRDAERVRFGRILNVFLALAFGYGAYDAWSYVVYGDRAALAQALIIGGLAALLGYARFLVARNRVRLASLATAGTILFVVVFMVLVRPHLYPVLAVGSIMAVSLALPAVSQRALRVVLIVALIVVVWVVAYGAVFAPVTPSITPSGIQTVVFATALVAAIGLVLVALWHFSVRLKGVIEDTERVGRELQDSNTQLKQLDRLKSQFMNNAAHELNTPLTPIRLQLHLLKSGTGGDLAPRARHAVTIVDRNVERMAKLVGDVLDASRGQANRLIGERKSADLRDIIEDAVESFTEPAQAAGIELESHHHVALPVEVDSRRMTQVLYNLITNAIKFTPRGGNVRITSRIQDNAALITVADTGMGIRPADIPRLFSPFSQVHEQTGRTHQGTGLGLFIARSILEEHGGGIVCQSEGLGKGASFVFTLPLRAIEGVRLDVGPRAPRGIDPHYEDRIRQLI